MDVAQGLACDPGIGITFQECVQDPVGSPVRELEPVIAERQREILGESVVNEDLPVHALGISAKHLARLNGLRIFTVEQLVGVPEKRLQTVFTKSETNILKSRSIAALRDARRSTESPGTADGSIQGVGLGDKPLRVLQLLGVRELKDMNSVRVRDLRARPDLGKSDLLQIQRVMKKLGIDLSD
jgi:hypothetical protein